MSKVLAWAIRVEMQRAQKNTYGSLKGNKGFNSMKRHAQKNDTFDRARSTRRETHKL